MNIYKYPYFYIKIIILFICLVVMSISTFMNDLIKINIDFSDNSMLKNTLNSMINKIKLEINDKFGTEFSPEEIECINKKLEELKNVTISSNIILGTHKLFFSIDIKILDEDIYFDEELIYTEFENNNKLIGDKIKRISDVFIKILSTKLLKILSNIIYVPIFINNMYGLNINYNKYPECLNSEKGKTVFMRLLYLDSNEKCPKVEGFHVEHFQNLDRLTSILSNLDDSKKNFLLNQLNEYVDTDQYLCNYLSNITNFITKNQREFNINFIEEELIEMIFKSLTGFFALFITSSIIIFIMLILLSNNLARTYTYQFISYFQLIFMVIISIIFILLIEVKIPQLNQYTVGLFNFKITPAISGILFFVATGLFILNKLLKTRRTVLSFQSKSNIR